MGFVTKFEAGKFIMVFKSLVKNIWTGHAVIPELKDGSLKLAPIFLSCHCVEL